MGWASAIGNLLNPGDAEAVDRASGAISDTIAPGSEYWQSGDLGLAKPGTQGNALVGQAARIGATNVGANFAPMDQDASALRKIGEQYYDQFLHGGKAEEAAKNRAVSSMADAGGGGIIGVDRLQAGSEQLSQQALSTSLQERGNAGAQANSANLTAGMLAIRKLAIQTAATHANVQKNLGAQQALNNLQNTQGQLNNQLTAGANAAQHEQAIGGIGVESSQQQLGLGLLSAGIQGAATAGSLYTGMSGPADVPNIAVSESQIQNEAANTYAKLGFEPTKLTGAIGATGQEAAQATQDALTSALTGSSKIVYPSLQSDATNLLTNKTAFPVSTSLR